MISSIFEKSELCKSCTHTKVCMKDKNVCGDVFVTGNPMIFDNNELWKKYKDREAKGFPCEDYQKEIVRCEKCKYYNAEEKMCNDINGFGRYWKPTDFCSYGERSEDVKVH